MDPFDKTQTDPIWQRVWNHQPLTPPAPPGACPSHSAAQTGSSPSQTACTGSAASAHAAAAAPPVRPGVTWTSQELLHQSRAEADLGAGAWR